MIGGLLRAQRLGDADLAYNMLRKATFGALIYSTIFLQIAIQPLWVDPNTTRSSESLGITPIALVLNAALLLLPVLILFLFCFGYYGLFHRAAVGLPAELRESIWKARVFFQSFWIIIGLAVLFLIGSGAASLIGSPESVRLALFLALDIMPTALVIALLLFLGHTVCAALPTRGRFLLQWLVWAEVLLAAISAGGTSILTALRWRDIEASGVIKSTYSPWTTIPSSVLLVVTLMAIYFAFRWVGRHAPLSRGSPAQTPSSERAAGDFR
jgi:hypothetical protein